MNNLWVLIKNIYPTVSKWSLVQLYCLMVLFNSPSYMIFFCLAVLSISVSEVLVLIVDFLFFFSFIRFFSTYFETLLMSAHTLSKHFCVFLGNWSSCKNEHFWVLPVQIFSLKYIYFTWVGVNGTDIMIAYCVQGLVFKL